MSRAIAKTFIPDEVEEKVWNIFKTPAGYAYKVKQLKAWSETLGIPLTVDHVTWDDEMWRMGTESGSQWDNRREQYRPHEAKQITFEKETLLQCPSCSKNMVLITKTIQKRGCDEPATAYCVCKNPACKKRLGREHRFTAEC